MKLYFKDIGVPLDIIKRIIQMKNFWSSILSGPERNLGVIEELDDFPRTVDSILLWIYELFPIPSNSWMLDKASKNPHSEVFLFCQTNYSDCPKKVFVKRFIVQMENKNKFNPKGLMQEVEALKRISEFNGRYQVYAPIFYGYNPDLCLLATSFQEGKSFFNEVFEPPVKVLVDESRSKDFKKSLSNLGNG